MLPIHMHILNKEAFLRGAETVAQQKNYSPTTCNLIIMRKPTCKCNASLSIMIKHAGRQLEKGTFFKVIQPTSAVVEGMRAYIIIIMK